LFQGGRLYYSCKGNQAAWEQAKLAYQQTVLNALGEVLDTLVARQQFAQSRLELEKQVKALQESARLATLRYTGGLATYYEALEAQQQLFPAEDSLARTELNQRAAVAQWYRALGGGWRAEEDIRGNTRCAVNPWTRSCRGADGPSESRHLESGASAMELLRRFWSIDRGLTALRRFLDGAVRSAIPARGA